MDDMLHIVIYRFKGGGKWKPETNGLFEGADSERLAKNYAECLNKQFSIFEHRVVAGPIVCPETMEMAEARLGVF